MSVLQVFYSIKVFFTFFTKKLKQTIITFYYASYCTLCFILCIMRHTVHYASYCTLCVILYIMLHTVHYASYCTICFILYIMLHTVHYATRQTVELSIVSTHHNRGGKYVNKLALFIKKTRSFPFRYTIIKGPSPKNMQIQKSTFMFTALKNKCSRRLANV